MSFFIKSKKGKKELPVPLNSYSQCGEDLLVDYIFKLRGIERPSYLDIGAHDPYYLSNTALFYQRGSRGINIEANPTLIPKFQEHRAEDINLNVGLGKAKGLMDFYVMQDSTLSTFSKKECKKMYAHGKEVREVVKINLTTINQILIKYCKNIFPDFLTIDVEGMDFQILQTIDFSKSYPKVICVEAAEYSPIGAGKRRNELITFLEEHGYHEYANTNLNAIMVKNEFWFI